jgi:putative AdoMet-dependent methyltransferase
MMNSNIFDVWASEYDKDVRLADENNEYPFAGYKKIMSTIFAQVNEKSAAAVLDIGVGTGTLSAALYEARHNITGIDFSSEMLAIAKAKMPNASFHQCDMAHGLPPEIAAAQYDFIISTYALHHLTDALKAEFIKSLLPHLRETGVIIIGDVDFATRDDLKVCEAQNADDWDDEEFYFVFDELADALGDACLATFEKISHCAGILVFARHETGGRS